MRRCVKNSVFMEELMRDLQNKLVQSEVLFGRLVSNQTSEINDVKRLCILQKYKLYGANQDFFVV